jgi:hypothetical protein
MLAQPNSWKKLAGHSDAAEPKKATKPTKQAKPAPTERAVHAAADAE